MADLADYLAAQLEQMSYRDLEGKTGVSRGSLEKIVKRKMGKFPELETLQRIADAFSLPLWRVIEMAGVDLGLSKDLPSHTARVAAQLEHSPMLWQIVQRLIDASNNTLLNVLAFIRYQEATPSTAELPSDIQSMIAPFLETPEGRERLKRAAQQLITESEHQQPQ